MKKEYEKIEAEVIRFNPADVLAASSTNSDSEKENSYIDAGDLFTTEPGGWFWFSLKKQEEKQQFVWIAAFSVSKNSFFDTLADVERVR